MSGANLKLDPLRNPLDPLRKTMSEQEQELFRKFYADMQGYDRSAVMGAITNLIANVLREVDDTHKKANDHIDRFAVACKVIVGQHYDNLGRRRNIFPHHQYIDVPYLGKLGDTKR